MKNQSSQSSGQNLLSRPPIVVVMGHIDHGKTTLLDFIRKTGVAQREAGGITQSIGAYEITHNSKSITFIDTPGHEVFSKMRARGANVADLAILVVAADDGVKPQTKESIEILNQAKTPFIVAINKIDKNNADIEKAKNDLAQNGVLLEGNGGNISWHTISAKTGEGVNELLDLILLSAELEQLTYNPNLSGSGFIIESKMDSQRGLTAMAIVKNGILKVGEKISTQGASGKVKVLENFLGKRVDKLEPSSPALIMGFESLPGSGEEFFTGKNIPDEFLLKKSDTSLKKTRRIIDLNEDKQSQLNLVLRGGVVGSLEALSSIIRSLPQGDAKVNIIDEGVGDITDGDVKTALPQKATIIGFGVKVSKAAENLVRDHEVEIITSDIIYELVKSIEDKIKSYGKPKIIGELEVLGVFSKKEKKSDTGKAVIKKQVIGGKVVSGVLKNKIEVDIFRGENQAGFGRISNLQKGKQDVAQVKEGEECGILFDSESIIKVGDKLVYMNHEA